MTCHGRYIFIKNSCFTVKNTVIRPLQHRTILSIWGTIEIPPTILKTMSNIASLKPFQSGHDPRRNTKGRPKGSGNISNTVKKLLKKEIGEGKNKKKIEELLIESILKKALKGDIAMIKLIWEYSDGKPARQKSEPYWDQDYTS